MPTRKAAAVRQETEAELDARLDKLVAEVKDLPATPGPVVSDGPMWSPGADADMPCRATGEAGYVPVPERYDDDVLDRLADLVNEAMDAYHNACLVRRR